MPGHICDFGTTKTSAALEDIEVMGNGAHLINLKMRSPFKQVTSLKIALVESM